MTDEWTIYARDANGFRVGQVDQFETASFKPVYCDVGSWNLTMDRRLDIAAALCQPGAGIILCRNDNPIFSGPWRQQSHTKSSDAQEVTFTGVTDEIWLKRRVASPSPAESTPPYTVQASDVQTGVASTVLRHYVDVNAGPNAVPPRCVPGLTIGVDPVIGATVKGEARWDNLLALLQPLAVSGGVGFRVVQVGNTLQFQVYAATDHTGDVKYSVDLGNLASFQYESTAPDTNYEYVGGTGTGTGRTIKEVPDPDSLITWGRIEGEFIDQSSTSDDTQLTQAANDALENGGEQASITITPIESSTQRYGFEYGLGDKITVILDGPSRNPYNPDGRIQDIIRTVSIDLTQDSSLVTPSIGTAARQDAARSIRAINNLKRRVNNLETT